MKITFHSKKEEEESNSVASQKSNSCKNIFKNGILGKKNILFFEVIFVYFKTLTS